MNSKVSIDAILEALIDRKVQGHVFLSMTELQSNIEALVDEKVEQRVKLSEKQFDAMVQSMVEKKIQDSMKGRMLKTQTLIRRVESCSKAVGPAACYILGTKNQMQQLQQKFNARRDPDALEKYEMKQLLFCRVEDFQDFSKIEIIEKWFSNLLFPEVREIAPKDAKVKISRDIRQAHEQGCFSFEELHGKDLYVLLGIEIATSEEARRKYGDDIDITTFGGMGMKGESRYETAIRELREESLDIFDISVFSKKIQRQKRCALEITNFPQRAWSLDKYCRLYFWFV